MCELRRRRYIKQEAEKWLASRLASHHVDGDGIGQHDSLVDEVSDDLHAETAGGERGEKDEEEGGDEGHGNGYQDEDKEPDDGPRPAEAPASPSFGMSGRSNRSIVMQ